ncbi:hypothetical protein QFZ29_002751 [Agromyces albus]|nr:hypothetical protein [Agromyces albus]MDQ0576528.1 hypothetical protein [Agromyces albus]
MSANQPPVLTQETISAEISAIHEAYRERADATGRPLPVHPPARLPAVPQLGAAASDP